MEGNITLIMQARMDSTRLPGKILRPLAGKPMLQQEIDRLKHCSVINTIVLATTADSSDDQVVELGKESDVSVFRGSENDVLDRYYQAAKDVKAETIVRVTGDCPLHDPEVVDMVVDRFRKRKVDYARTPDNYPEGLDTEVMTFAALERAWKEARLPSEREHVTPFIRNHPELFRVDAAWTVGTTDYSRYHWSVDTEQDFRFAAAVYAHFGDTMFHMRDVLTLLEEKPELLNINKGGTGYEGLEKSLKEDEKFRKSHE
jgi:spore coat polysaccharide biosynthesis protein SpsF